MFRSELDELIARGVAEYGEQFTTWYETTFTNKQNGKKGALTRIEEKFADQKYDEAFRIFASTLRHIRIQLKNYPLKNMTTLDATSTENIAVEAPEDQFPVGDTVETEGVEVKPHESSFIGYQPAAEVETIAANLRPELSLDETRTGIDGATAPIPLIAGTSRKKSTAKHRKDTTPPRQIQAMEARAPLTAQPNNRPLLYRLFDCCPRKWRLNNSEPQQDQTPVSTYEKKFS